MKQATLRIVLCSLGLTGLGIIVTEILKKWTLIEKDLGSVWIVVPILILFTCSEVLKSGYIDIFQDYSPELAHTFVIIVNAVLIIVSILALISIPLIWFGTIEELARGGGLR